MIDSKERLFFASGAIGYEASEPSQWYIVDYDTRKWIKFEGPTNPFGLEEEGGEGERAATKVLLPVIDNLDKGVTKVTFSADGKRWHATHSPEDDETEIVEYPKFSHNEVGEFAHATLTRDCWTEKDRLGPGVDLIEVTQADKRLLFVYKYCIVNREMPLRRLWDGAFIHKALSHHPNVVPFGHFVVYAKTLQYVGYTTRYIPGSSLNKKNLTKFKRNWVKQLMDLVDELNLKYGLVHQDIAPRNLLLPNDHVLLFDFDYATPIGSQYVMPFVDDVADLCFTVYELLTGDRQFEARRRDRKLESIMSSQKHWHLKKGMQLESQTTIEMIKNDLATWVHSRKNSSLPKDFELRASVIIPEMHKVLLPLAKPSYDEDGTLISAWLVKEADPKAHIIRWERPASAHRALGRSPIH